MRKITVKMAGRDVCLAATFETMEEVAERVADPLMIAREARVEATLIAAGIPYTPRWVPDAKNVPLLLHIGAKVAGENYTLKEMRKLVFDHGLIPSSAIAMDYVAIVVMPQSEEIGEAKGEPSGE